MGKSDDLENIPDDKSDETIPGKEDNKEFSQWSRFEKKSSDDASYSPDINDLDKNDPPQGSETPKDKESE